MTSLAQVRSSPNITNGSVAGDLELSCDVCIIGSGAGGAVTASTLAKAGIDVLIVEEGGYYAHSDFTTKEHDVVPKLYQEALLRTTADGAIAILQGKAVGGTTVVNYTTSFRTPEYVVEHWKKRHGVKGFQYADLAPHWDWIEARLGIHKVPEEEMNANNRSLFDACKAMGWQADTLRRNVVACMQSGFCGLGCPVNAKRSMLVTLVPDAIDAGARLVYRARIDKLETSGSSVTKATATFFDADGLKPTGKKLTIKAKRFILSGGAINTPGVLLRSGITLGGLVGERTFLHPVIGSLAEYEQIIDPWKGAPQSAASHHFYDRGEKVGVFFEASPFYPGTMGAGTPGFGPQHQDLIGRIRHVAIHIALVIDGFHEDVIGGKVRLRADGSPVLDYPIPASVWEALKFGQRKLAEAAFAGGAKAVHTLHDPVLSMASKDDCSRVESMPFRNASVPVFTAHQMGGCRMGDDPRTSVVRSEDCRMHEMDNVWVIDGSVFPTSVGVNPQESIYGLARLMATRFTEKHA